MATVKALLGLPFDMPSLDYSSLMQLTDILTIHEPTREVSKLIPSFDLM